MKWLSDMMLEVLRFFYAIGGQNYGLAIVWLTIAVNLALYPLTLSSVQQMMAMQRIQPRLKELQKKHKDEPQKMQKEMMDLYRSEGVNPFGGCLPVLLKIPFFIALFWGLQSKVFGEMLAVSGGGASFLWILNIAKPDPLKIMPVLIGISTYFMQKSMPASGEQAMMMNWMMPLFLVFISLSFPAGVQIYWLVSNVMGAVQQYYVMKKEPPKSRRRKENKDEKD